MARRIIPIILLLAAAGAGFYYWQESSRYETTDDAQIDGRVAPISARISGNITAVLVEDHQLVKAGQPLVELDPHDYEVAVAKARADLLDAQANLRAAKVDVPITSTNTASTLRSARSGKEDATAARLSSERQLAAAKARLESARARVAEAEANATKADQDLKRYKALVEKDEISRQQYDSAVATAAAAQATLLAQKAAVAEAEQNVTVSQSLIEQTQARLVQADASIQAAMTAPQQVESKQARVMSAEAQVQARQAALDQAELNLKYTKILAPISGIVGKKTAEVGQNVSPGQELMAVVPADDIWITANFKETQLRNMKPGQRVSFTVDALAGEYKGTVERIAGASGAKFSVMPPENATGNYVKVVQRIPVRIRIEPGQDNDHRMRVGMSVLPKVYNQ